jgi:hypothetical protein
VNADLSVAPEIALLAASPGPPPQARVIPSPRTAGRIAAALSGLAAAPQRWWDLVRFDPDGPVRIPVPGADGTWLLVLPPGAAADCDCRYATPLAGEAAESPLPPPPGEAAESPLPPLPGDAAESPLPPPPGEAAESPLPPLPAPQLPAPAPARPLRPGRVRVHGRHAPHQIRGAGHGYSVSLHWTDGATGRSEEIRDFVSERPVAEVSQRPLYAHPAIPPGEYSRIITTTDAGDIDGRAD